MKIKNDTKYSTRTLRSIVTAVRRRFEAHHKPVHNWERLSIEFVPATHANSRVRLRSYTPTAFAVQLPSARPLTERIVLTMANEVYVTPPTMDSVVDVIARGLMYSNGYGILGLSLLRLTQSMERKHGHTLEVPVPKPKIKHGKDKVQEKRYKALLVREKTWVRKSKLAATKLKALKKKRKYYEKELGIT